MDDEFGFNIKNYHGYVVTGKIPNLEELLSGGFGSTTKAPTINL